MEQIVRFVYGTDCKGISWYRSDCNVCLWNILKGSCMEHVVRFYHGTDCKVRLWNRL